MRSRVRFLLLTLTLLAPLLLLGWLVQAQPLPATPTSSANLQLIGHSGGAVTAIARQGNDLVLASGPVLELLDVSDAGAPARRHPRHVCLSECLDSSAKHRRRG